ncbi:hypothetical protein [Natronobacterium texcoconense]|uniref:Uncharacterized protein n=1 Tax=Natronobacterium texcoconense TaxID=1095778 RepID=A0A1H1GV07_NATTX|nr:hypothetical protein [Natronobacterium texcoconense]SDR16903.1 hypothetical protein SAMN04489842_2622 [Natronobacterium texcoconense]
MSRRRTRNSSDENGNYRRIGAAFVALVGLSGGTMALQGDASMSMVGLATIGSLLAGGVLAWYLAWIVS